MDGWIRIGTRVETKDFDAQIKELERKAQTLEKTLETDMQIPVKLRMSKDERIKLEADLEKTKNQILSLQQQANKGINLKPKETENGFKNMLKSAKKFALGLISIRGVYSILSKASQAYMQTDEASSKQMEANWVGLGAILAPAIDLIVKLFKKAVTSVLYFMSVLTGVNYIEKANTAILKKQTQATNDLTKANNNLTASFDEMNVLQNSSSSGTNIGAETLPLFDINDIGEDTRKTIEKIATALKPVYDIAKQLIDWALKNPEVVLGILGGIKLIDTLGKIIGFAGTGSKGGIGLLGVWGAAKLIAALGTITTVLWVDAEIRDSQKKLDNFINEMEEMVDTYDGYIIKMKVKFEEEPTEENKAVLMKALESKKNAIQTEIDALKDSLTWYLWVFDPAGYYDIKDKIEELEKELQGVNTEIENIDKDTDIAISDAKVGVDGLKSDLGKTFDRKWSLNVDEIDAKKKIKETSDKLGYTFNKSYPVDVDITEAEEDLTTVDTFLNTTFGEKYKIDTDKLDAIKNINEVSKQLDKEITKTRTFKVDSDTSSANYKFKTLFNGFGTKLSGFFGSLGLKISIPKLATGGIVNNPGSGVFMGSYIAGERGREGIIPLTDAQAMQQLGQEIGKWISINATIPISVGNRQIAREIRKIEAEENFAFNK